MIPQDHNATSAWNAVASTRLLHLTAGSLNIRERLAGARWNPQKINNK